MSPEAPQTELLTQRAYALARGHDPSLVTRWKKRGRLVFVGGLVDATATDARLKETADPTRAGVVRSKARQHNGDASADLDEIRRQRARREGSAADEAEIRVRARRGEYLDAHGVRLAIADAGREIVQALENIPGRIGHQMAAELGVPPHTTLRLLEDELTQFRQDVAERLHQLAAKYPEPK